jgi:formylglycine-generating enzyme required for sulfatase activity
MLAPNVIDGGSMFLPIQQYNLCHYDTVSALAAARNWLLRARPTDLFPPRFAQLGYEECVLHGVEVILPPTCDVPAGEFLMGSDPARDPEAQEDERPQHWVTLPAYAIARYPVTVAEYACFVRVGHAEPRSQYDRLTWRRQLRRPDHPVVNVTWHDAVAYTAWLANLTGQPWRLPSEAEWEKAARWDTATHTARIYPWGDIFDKRRANTSESRKKMTTPMGSYPSGASPCGAQDTAGNVWEWTSSLERPYPYSASDGRERPETPEADAAERRMMRGGCWGYRPTDARTTCRVGVRPADATVFGGFRVVRAVLGQ